MENNKIINRIEEQKNDALKSCPTDWFVICGQGSINYPGLSDNQSDVDTKMLTIPSFESIVLNKKPINYVHEMENSEHVDLKDVREYMKIARKQNINFVEVFFTDYWIANSNYQDIWLDMMRHAEEFAHMNPYRTLKCCKGMIYEKYHALEHRYPSRAYYIDTFGYDGKQLQHALRILEFAEKFVKGYPYKECLSVKDPDNLLAIKRHKANINVEQARKIMDNCVKSINNLEVKHNQYHKDEEDEKTRLVYDNILYELIKRSVKKEIM